MFIPSISLLILFYKKFVDREVGAADPEEAQHTHHGVGVPLVQLNFLDALAGCPAHWRLANVYPHSLKPDCGLGV